MRGSTTRGRSVSPPMPQLLLSPNIPQKKEARMPDPKNRTEAPHFAGIRASFHQNRSQTSSHADTSRQIIIETTHAKIKLILATCHRRCCCVADGCSGSGNPPPERTVRRASRELAKVPACRRSRTLVRRTRGGRPRPHRFGGRGEVLRPAGIGWQRCGPRGFLGDGGLPSRLWVAARPFSRPSFSTKPAP
jgi:hypothetical protein